MSEFVEYLHEVFEQFGPIRSRKMFGGHGIYHNDLMFALVADDQLYLKTDQENLPLFEELDLQAFEFHSDNKITKMSYYSAPEDLFDDPELAKQWADIAFDAALRNHAIKERQATKRKTSKNTKGKALKKKAVKKTK